MVGCGEGILALLRRASLEDSAASRSRAPDKVAFVQAPEDGNAPEPFPHLLSRGDLLVPNQQPS